MPDTQASFSGSKAGVDSGGEKRDVRGTALLAGSLSLAGRYAGEYMDETPLVGEPGGFILQKFREGASQLSQVQTQSQSQATSTSTSQATSMGGRVGNAGVGGSAGEGSGKPAPLKTENLPPADKKARVAEKTPVTPGTAGREKKRKKSKAAILTTGTAVGTPK